MVGDDLQASERSNESGHERKGVQDVASIGNALLVDNLKVGVVISVPAAVSEKTISTGGMSSGSPEGLTRSTRT